MPWILIRIQIWQNDADPTWSGPGSGSTTLLSPIQICWKKQWIRNILVRTWKRHRIRLRLWILLFSSVAS
jgi:hypothetical protein